MDLFIIPNLVYGFFLLEGQGVHQSYLYSMLLGLPYKVWENVSITLKLECLRVLYEYCATHCTNVKIIRFGYISQLFTDIWKKFFISLEWKMVTLHFFCKNNVVIGIAQYFPCLSWKIPYKSGWQSEVLYFSLRSYKQLFLLRANKQTKPSPIHTVLLPIGHTHSTVGVSRFLIRGFFFSWDF